MSDTNPETKTAAKAPSHIAWQVRDGSNGKSYWNRLGVAWSHADGKGFNVQLEAVPLDGRISIRVASEKKE